MAFKTQSKLTIAGYIKDVHTGRVIGMIDLPIADFPTYNVTHNTRAVAYYDSIDDSIVSTYLEEHTETLPEFQ
mgnify:CR=1 FL=1